MVKQNPAPPVEAENLLPLSHPQHLVFGNGEARKASSALGGNE
jgi:hypothetical protein